MATGSKMLVIGAASMLGMLVGVPSLAADDPAAENTPMFEAGRASGPSLSIGTTGSNAVDLLLSERLPMSAASGAAGSSKAASAASAAKAPASGPEHRELLKDALLREAANLTATDLRDESIGERSTVTSVGSTTVGHTGNAPEGSSAVREVLNSLQEWFSVLREHRWWVLGVMTVVVLLGTALSRALSPGRAPASVRTARRRARV